MTDGGGLSPKDVDNDRLLIVVDVWKYIVSVQMHFNEIEMKIRNLYFTVIAASLGLIGVVQGKRIEFYNPEFSASLSVLVLLALIPISMLFYFMDRHWYHRLLQGSVNQGIEIENKYSGVLSEIQLGSKIKIASPVEFKGWVWKVLFFFVVDPNFRIHSRLHSDAKIEILYKSVIWASAFLVLAYIPIGGIRINGCALLPLASSKVCWKAPVAIARPADASTPPNAGGNDKAKVPPSPAPNIPTPKQSTN